MTLLRELQRMARLAVSRARIGRYASGPNPRTVQAELLRDEVRDGVQLFQHVGFASRPKDGAEAIAVAVGGSRDDVVAVATHDRRHPGPELAEGEAAVWSSAGAVLRAGDDGDVHAGLDLHVDGDLVAGGDLEDHRGTLELVRQLFDAHTHPTPAGQSGPPVPLMTAAGGEPGVGPGNEGDGGDLGRIPSERIESLDGSKITGEIDPDAIPAEAVTQHSGAIEHGDLAGLGDDDHVHYLTTERADSWLTSKDSDDLAEGAAHLYLTAAERTKLAGIETGATGDQTPAEILAALLTVDGAGSLLDADLLDGYEAAAFPRKAESATISAAWTHTATHTVSGVDFAHAYRVLHGSGVSGFAVAVNEVTLDLRTSSNAAGVTLSGASGSGIFAGDLVVSGLVDGRDVSVDGAKLDGIEAGATADQTAAEILSALLTVDGAGSLLDADLLDGYEASAFPRKAEDAVITGQYRIHRTDSAGILHLGGGDVFNGSNNRTQLRFGYEGSSDWPHFVRSRHNNAPTSNAIDFYTCDGTQAGTFPTNAVHGLTIENGKVGVGTTSPSATLDVDGSANVDGGLTVGGDIDVSGTVDGRTLSADGAKLDGIEPGATADQTPAEILAALLTVDGAGSLLDADLLDGRSSATYVERIYESRSLPTTVGDYVEIGTASRGNGGHAFSIHAVVTSGGFSTAKSYVVVGAYNEHTTWTTLPSLVDTGAYFGEDFELEIRVLGNDVTLRARRTGGTTAGTVLVTIHSGEPDGFTWTALSGTGTSDATGTYDRLSAGIIGTAQLADDAVTPAKLADVASSTIRGRVTAGTGNVEDLTPAQVRTLLNVADGANAYVHPNHTGEVTSVGDGALTISPKAVSNAKLSTMAAATVKGRAAGSGTDSPVDLTAAQLVAILDTLGAWLSSSAIAEHLVTGYHIAEETVEDTNLADGAVTQLKVQDGAITNAKAADMAQATIKGRAAGAGTGDPTDLTPAQARAVLNVEEAGLNPIRFEWTDFHGMSTPSHPFQGYAINGGSQSASPPSAMLQAGTAGITQIRSSTSANSGYAYRFSNMDRIVGQSDLLFRAIFAVNDDMTSKTIRFGFLDTTDQSDAVDGAYFELAAGSLACTPKTSSNSTRTSGTSYTLTAGTYYQAEVYWTSTSSILFRILSLDGATVHLSTSISTNIPTGTSRVFGAGLLATSSGTAVDDLWVIDYAGVGFKALR